MAQNERLNNLENKTNLIFNEIKQIQNKYNQLNIYFNKIREDMGKVLTQMSQCHSVTVIKRVTVITMSQLSNLSQCYSYQSCHSVTVIKVVTVIRVSRLTIMSQCHSYQSCHSFSECHN